MVAIKDVAKRAGVSTATVSYVLNNRESISQRTRERVLQAAAELGYRPSVIAQGLQAGRSRMLGYCWTPQLRWQYSPILDRFLQSMAEAATAHGFHVLTFPARSAADELAAYRDMVHTARVDGFALSSTDLDDARIRYLMGEHFPFVAFGRSNRDWEFPYVDVDGGDGMREAVEHLVSLGHRRIACLTWEETSLVGGCRMCGYTAGLARAGLPVDADLVMHVENDYAQARAATHSLLALPRRRRPTAVVCVSDLLAMGAMNAASEAGLRVGVDLAVSGFDDAPMVQYLLPPLTSIRQPVAEVGERVIEMLVALLRGEPLAEPHVLLAPRLIVRASTQPE